MWIEKNILTAYHTSYSILSSRNKTNINFLKSEFVYFVTEKKKAIAGYIAMKLVFMKKMQFHSYFMI